MRGAEFLDLWGYSVFASVLADAVHGLDIDEQGVAALESEPDGFESLAALGLCDESAEDAYAVVDVDHVVAYVEGAELAERDALLLLAHIVVAEREPLEAVENLMVGVEAEPCLLVDEAAMESEVELGIGEVSFSLAKYGAETLELAAVV